MDPLDTVFAALADATRRAIVVRLAQGETHVGDLLLPLAISGPAVSRHLRVLERAGLIERSVAAQRRICRLRGPGLRVAHDWLSQYRGFWEESLDRLASLLEEPPAPPSAAPVLRGGSKKPAPAPKRRQAPPRRSRKGS
jgi:DNA-binding transcriptional ArsR family regulator